VLWARVFAVGDAPSCGGRGARERRLLGVEPFKSNVSKWPGAVRCAPRDRTFSAKNPGPSTNHACRPNRSSESSGSSQSDLRERSFNIPVRL
jgi:hypothetical protein